MPVVMRADKLLVERALVPSRTQAQRLIAEGKVRYRVGNDRGIDQNNDWLVVHKSSDNLPDNAIVDIIFDANDRFVSRGGLKLAHALATLAIDVTGWVALDIGQSTGGFTDCLLQVGCAKVVGVDVGHDQLDARLRHDPRVVCLEGINARALDIASLCRHNNGQPFDIIVMDVSFISQTLILGQLSALLAPDGWLISLVKPQFELTRAQLGKGGIVRDIALYAQVQQRITQCLEQTQCLEHTQCLEPQGVEHRGLQSCAWLDSPIEGGDGNREFLCLASHRT